MSSRGFQKQTIDAMHSLASAKEGKCLDSEYINAKTKLTWECKQGHTWFATANSIQQGHWCPDCARARSGATQRLNLQAARQLANHKGGLCKSHKYQNISHTLLWQCGEGHEWEASFGSIKRGSWCPICSQGISERICRAVLENGLETAFSKARPKWLINAAGNQMELDGYSLRLNIAFEYNGRQHYSDSKFFHSAGSTLIKRKADDARKRELCERNGVHLITIPFNIKLDAISDFLYRAVTSYGLSADREKFKWSATEVYHSRAQLIEVMRQIANGHGGACLSPAYVDMNTKLRWRCKIGHEWDSVPSSIQQGVWCPLCARVRAADSLRESIEDMQKLAAEKKGFCISSTYLNSQEKLLWLCEFGHQWSARPFSIKKGHWCPSCAKSGSAAKKSIDEFKMIAANKGGFCVSDSYLGIHQKLKWRCADGHEWDATAGSVLRGTWCRKCGRIKLGRKMKKTIADMQKLAAVNNGICLSTEYLDAKSKLTWLCAQGHQWESTPSNIQKGSWCPHCARRGKAPIKTVID